MGIEKITEMIKLSCADDPNMEEMLMELFQFQLEGRGRYKEKYKEIIKKHVKEDSAI